MLLELAYVAPSLITGAAITTLILFPRLQRGAKAEVESKLLRENAETAVEGARARARAEGLFEGKQMAEKEFWDGFARELFPDLDVTNSFPLRKKTVIKVKERLTWRGACTFGGWEVVTTVTLTREIASAAELGGYLKELVAPLIPIATKVLLAGMPAL